VLNAPPPRRETLAYAPIVARGQSSLSAGLIDPPPDRMLSAYHTLVPDKSRLVATRCAGSDAASALPATTAPSAERVPRTYVPTITIELFVSNSSELVGASGSGTQRAPSTMNAYS